MFPLITGTVQAVELGEKKCEKISEIWSWLKHTIIQSYRERGNTQHHPIFPHQEFKVLNSFPMSFLQELTSYPCF